MAEHYRALLVTRALSTLSFAVLQKPVLEELVALAAKPLHGEQAA